MYRAQYQIKCKQMFSGVFKVDPISHCISDSRDRICGYLADVYHEKGFFKALKTTQPGGLVKLTCPWISASKDLFEDANKYCLTGIKYVRIQDICKDGPCADIATLCSDSPRWMSVQAKKQLFLQQTGIYEKYVMGQRPKVVKQYIERIAQVELPDGLYHLAYPDKAKPYTDLSVFESVLPESFSGSVIGLTRFSNGVRPSLQVVLKVDLSKEDSKAFSCLLEGSRQPLHPPPFEIDLAAIRRQIPIGKPGSIANKLLGVVAFSMVGQAYLDIDPISGPEDGNYIHGDILRALNHRKSDEFQYLKIDVY